MALSAEDRQRGARAVERPHEVDVHHPLHHAGVHLVDASVVAEAGVADHDVETPERLLSARDEPHDLCFPRHVHDHRRGTPPGSSDLLHGDLEPIASPRTEHNRHAFVRKVFSNSQPDP